MKKGEFMGKNEKKLAKIDSNKVRAALLEKHMTREDLAKHLGIHKVTFDRKLCGARNWQLDEVLTMVKLFDKPLEFFLE